MRIKKVAVIGSGVMGAAIAGHIASSQIETILFDIVPNKLTPEEAEKGLTLDDKVVRNRLAQNGYEIVTNKKTGMIYDQDFCGLVKVANLEDDLELLGECDWVIEVVVERIDIKHQVLAKIAPYLKPTAIVSTNTSGISVTEISAGLPLDLRANFLGTHFFNPVRYMHLMEIIPTNTTSPEAVKFISEFITNTLGKGVVVCKDTPNFIGNRIGVHASCVAIKTYLKYDFDFAQIDTFTGPLLGRSKSAMFRTADMVGLDILPHVTRTCLEEIDPNTEDLSVFELPSYFLDMVANGQLGNKAKHGFFKKEFGPKGRVFKVWNPKRGEYLDIDKTTLPAVALAKSKGSVADTINCLCFGDDEVNKFAWELTTELLHYSAITLEDIAHSFEDVDNAMKWGYNWTVGPFELFDIIGLEKVLAIWQQEGKTAPAWLVEKASSDNPRFYQGASRYLDERYELLEMIAGKAAAYNMGDGVVCIEFRNPGNSLDRPTLSFVQKIVKMVEASDEYVGTVIGSKADNFCAGANLADVLPVISSGDLDLVDDFVTSFQNMSKTIKYSKKPVVSAIKGMVLGGGVEVAIHSHKIVAAAETYMGFVEAGVGILPAARGCVEMASRAYIQAERIGVSDPTPFIKNVWENMAMAKVSSSAFEARRMGYILETDRIIMNADQVLDIAKEEVLKLDEEGFKQKSFVPFKVLGTSGLGTFSYITLMMKDGNYISEHDKLIADHIANVLVGGDVPIGTIVTEEHMLKLESKGMAILSQTDKTQARMRFMLEKNKPLRN